MALLDEPHCEPAECLDCGRADGGCDRTVEGEPTRPLTPCGNLACTGCQVCVCPALEIEPQVEPTDAQVQAALDATLTYYATTWVGKIDPDPVDFDALRAAARVEQEGEAR